APRHPAIPRRRLADDPAGDAALGALRPADGKSRETSRKPAAKETQGVSADAACRRARALVVRPVSAGRGRRRAGAGLEPRRRARLAAARRLRRGLGGDRGAPTRRCPRPRGPRAAPLRSRSRGLVNAPLKFAESAVRRWQFPLLDSSERPSAPPEPRPPPHPQAPAAPDLEALARAAAERAEAAYAEAVERGLAEGREKGYAAGLEAIKPLEQRLVEQVERLNGILGRFD